MPHRLDQHFIHLGPGATAIAQPVFTDPSWYEAYDTRHAAEGTDGRLISQFTFTTDWDGWEMHPEGEEIVLCTAGSMTLHQQFADGRTARVALIAGDYAINPRGCWHTADVPDTATAIFITPGTGTQGRPR